MTDSLPDAFRRYAKLVEAALPPAAPFVPEAENASAVQVERGLLYAMSLRQPDDPALLTLASPLIDAAPDAGKPAPDVVDRLGHRRPVYRPLLIYAWLQAYRLAYESLPRQEFGRWEQALRGWCELLERDVADAAWPPDGPPASTGAAAAASCWCALCLWVAGKVFIRDAWTDLAGGFFGKLAAAQQPGGALLRSARSDNPETFWYHELAMLHAAAAYAVQAEDRAAARAVARATEYHQSETQPDHATAQPWGLFAFAWNAPTRPLADQLLHTAAVSSAASPAGGVSSLLLADALYCLRLFDAPP